MARVVSGPIIEFAVSRKTDSPLYSQVTDHLKRLIVSGNLPPGQRLPSSRQMASEMRVSRNTVLMAFEVLISEGYLVSRHGSGTFVMESVPDQVLKTGRAETPADAVGPPPKPARISRDAQRLVEKTRTMKEKRSAFSRQPDTSIFPFEIWTDLFSHIWRNNRVGQLNTQDAFGYLPFREAIAEHLASWRGVTCSPEQVMVTSGTTHAMHFLARLLLEPGDACWVENPGFIEAKSAIDSVDARAIPVTCDDRGMRVSEAIKSEPGARAAFVTPSHHHPFGTVLSDTRRQQLRQWAEETGGWIIEDDHDSEIRHSGQPAPTLKSSDQSDSVIYVGTFSKVTFQAIRLGFIVMPRRLVSLAKCYRALTEVCPPISMQPVMEKFIRRGHFTAHLRRARKLYCDKKNVFVERANRLLPSEHTLLDDNVGTHLVLRLAEDFVERHEDRALSSSLWERGIQATPLSEYYIGAPLQQGFLLGYGALEPDEMEYPLSVLAETLRARG